MPIVYPILMIFDILWMASSPCACACWAQCPSIVLVPFSRVVEEACSEFVVLLGNIIGVVRKWNSSVEILKTRFRCINMAGPIPEGHER